MNSAPGLLAIIGGLALTYLLHSTILLMLCWIATSLKMLSSQTLQCVVWKLGMVLGIFTPFIGLFVSTYQNSPVGWALFRPSEFVNANEQLDLGNQTSLDEVANRITQGSTVNARPLDHNFLAESSEASRVKATAAQPFESISATVVVPRTAIPNFSTTVLFDWVSWWCLSIGTVGFIRFVFQWNACRIVVRRARRERGGRTWRLLQTIQLRRSLRRKVVLLITDQEIQPFAAGLLQWRILVPRSVESLLDDEELTALLTHELGHLERGDVAWQWFGVLACNCLAFQPLNFVSRRRWQKASEFLTDQWAVENGVSALSLARCLTQVAQWACELKSNIALSSAIANGSRSHLKERVNELLNHSRLRPVPLSRNRLIRRVALLVAVAFVALGAYGPHCIPVQAMEKPLVPNGVSDLKVLWGETELEMQSLQMELEYLNLLLKDASQSAAVLEISNNIELHMLSVLRKRDRIGRQIMKRT